MSQHAIVQARKRRFLADRSVDKKVHAVVKRSTEPKKIQERREELEFCRLKVEKMVRTFFEEGSEKPSPRRCSRPTSDANCSQIWDS